MKGEIGMKTNNLERLLKRKASSILALIGAGGVVATGVAAARGTPKALILIEQAKQEKGEELTKLEIVVNAAPAYVPAIAFGTSSIICILGAEILNKKKQAALVSAYNVLANYHKNYREALINLKGESIEEEIHVEMARANYNFRQIDMDTPDAKCVWFDEMSGESFTRYEREIMNAEYHFNRNFTMRGYAYLNEWYSFIGLPPTDDGDLLGWSMEDGISWVDFEHYPIAKDSNSQAYCITPVYGPGMLDSEEYEL